MNKTWLITGASSGLGRLMTEQLLARGDRVVATLRREGALDDLQHRYGARIQVLKLDVTDATAVRSVTRQAFELMGRIDVVVSNAGYGLFGAAEELDDEQIDTQIATNLTGSIQLIRAVLPFMRAQRGGRILQVSSEGGQMAYPNFSLYHATKWGIEGFVESVRQEVAPFGIDFIVAEPGPTATNFANSLVRSDPMTVYDATPAGDVRRALVAGSFAVKGDAGKTAALMINAADAERPPFRLVLGSAAYQSIGRALGERNKAHENQRAVAFAADVD